MARGVQQRTRDPRTGIPADNECPACGYKLDAASEVAGDSIQPGPGDYSLCFGCAALLMFDSSMRSQLVRREDEASLPDELRAILAENADRVRRFRRVHPVGSYG